MIRNALVREDVGGWFRSSNQWRRIKHIYIGLMRTSPYKCFVPVDFLTSILLLF